MLGAFLNIDEYWKIEKLVLLAGGAFIGMYMLTQSDFPSFDELPSGSDLLFAFLPIGIFLGFTLFPYLLFFQIAKSIHNQQAGISSAKGRLILSLVIIPTSCWLYFASGRSIEDDPSSTASLIFAVLPFYICIVGCFLYGLVYWFNRIST